jgi:microcystin-dependent protein
VAQPYVGEIRMFAGTFAPAGWAFCDGQLLSIAENDVLFQLIGTTYGGDGQTTFALPDLRGRIPVHQDVGFALAEAGGQESVTLMAQQIPPHSHDLLASTQSANTSVPTGHVLAQTNALHLYSNTPPNVAMASQAIGVAGGSQPHDNMQPFLCVSFIISLFGIFPSQS